MTDQNHGSPLHILFTEELLGAGSTVGLAWSAQRSRAAMPPRFCGVAASIAVLFYDKNGSLAGLPEHRCPSDKKRLLTPKARLGQIPMFEHGRHEGACPVNAADGSLEVGRLRLNASREMFTDALETHWQDAAPR